MSHIAVVIHSSSAPSSPSHYPLPGSIMSCRPTRTSGTPKLYTSGISSGKTSSSSIKQKIDQRHNAHPRRLASFEEAVERETFARCLADLSMRTSRDTGIPRLYSSQRLSSPKYPPPFERSLSSSQLPRGDYGYIRSVTRSTSPTQSDARYSNQIPSRIMVRQHSEPGISSLHLRKAPKESPRPKASRSVEALVSPTSRQSSSTKSKLKKPSKTRACQSLEAINEPTGNQTVSSHLVARIPRKMSESGVEEKKKKEMTSQHTVVKLVAKSRKSPTQQRKRTSRPTHKPVKKSTSVDDKLCNSTSGKEKMSRKTGSTPKAKIVSVSQTQSKRDHNDNETSPTAVVQVVAKAPGSRGSRTKDGKAGIKAGEKERKSSKERPAESGVVKSTDDPLL